MGLYTTTSYDTGRAQAATYPGRTLDHVAVVRPQLPCTAIVVHGVNDVGVSYREVEAGLCAGMAERLGLPPAAFVPVDYRVFTDADRDRVEPDPDAVFFRRLPTTAAHSFVVPFYWGYRELRDKALTRNGQFTDRWGNRLDKDGSKGGGPFANATSTLPDLWNRGFGAPLGLERLSHDALRPLRDAPGRMYMVLAAMRLAALVSMIRDYDEHETVNVVAHSQGCMLSLLAQAFLLERGLRPADALVLTHPPYSLEDDLPASGDYARMFSGGEDEAMKAGYPGIAGVQTLAARLGTLVNIVGGVAAKRQTAPSLESLAEPNRCMVGARWSPAQDRDNRGKVYLYFCPEDATVGLESIRGIGWQGVPEHLDGSAFEPTPIPAWLPTPSPPPRVAARRHFEPLAALGASFFQRVFTGRKRVPTSGKGEPAPVPVGAPPADFTLCLPGELGWQHVDPSLRTLRADVGPPDARTRGGATSYKVALRHGIRRITGEALARPVPADMTAGAELGSHGTKEAVDAIDAAIAPTSDDGQGEIWLSMAAAPGVRPDPGLPNGPSPRTQTAFDGLIRELLGRHAEVDAQVNAKAETTDQRREVLQVFTCMQQRGGPYGYAGRLLVRCKESPDDTRRRFQHKRDAARSFHGAIFGSRENHRKVTAYDLAIGQGEAVSHPKFKDYLCAVADWRLTKDETSKRPIKKWSEFLVKCGLYYADEREWRKKLIEGNRDYYTTGELPIKDNDGRPVLPTVLPALVVNESSIQGFSS